MKIYRVSFHTIVYAPKQFLGQYGDFTFFPMYFPCKKYKQNKNMISFLYIVSIFFTWEIYGEKSKVPIPILT